MSESTPDDMSRPELEAEVRNLRNRISDLEEDISRVESNYATEQLINLLIQRLTNEDIDFTADPFDNLDVIADLQNTITEMEGEVAQLDAEVAENNSKREKVAAIVQFALNKRDGNPVVKLTPQEIKGATGISRRYAYDLCDDLPEEYDWILSPHEMQQYGEIELDHEKMGRKIGVDCEGVHGTQAPVNKFTTATSQDGGEE